MDAEIGESRPDNFREMLDEEIVAFAKRGSERATEHLLSKYRGLVEGKARSYYLVGADHEDVIQEGMIGLFKAIRDFRVDKTARFRAFAELCVTRQIITAVKTATRQKHVPLNRYISLHHAVSDDGSDVVLLDILPDVCVSDPEKATLNSHVREYLEGGVYTDLSDLESAVLEHYMQGMSYREIAMRLSCRTKSIDNALQRAKRKISLKMFMS